MSPPMERDFDLIVIGTGPAGQKAAVQAAKLGCSVLAVEKGGQVGGVSVHSGTIPSKALRQAALVLVGLRSRRLQGVRVTLHESLGVDDLISHTAELVSTETSIVQDQLRRNEVRLIQGTARFEGPHEIRVVSGEDESVYNARKIVVAVGAVPVHPPNVPFDGQSVHDYVTLLSLSHIPRRLVVIGAGVIGTEYACIFGALGCE